MIAAGEVVQRPSSVVKELMENALDAGATAVKVVVRDSGRTLIQVIDNGCGMTPDEAVLAFERHATSKITSATDLLSLHTFGFRGEALPSIAAVAQVRLSTRTKEQELGCRVEFEDSRHISTEEAAVPVGCNFEVRNIFYNVPARRKFLKSDSVELRHIVEEFTRVALTRYDVDFTLTHNDRELYVLKGARSMKYRIQELTSPALVSELLDVGAETSVVSVRGYASRPENCRKGPGNQYFFVNGRYFRSPYLHKAVMKAYENLISDGSVPSYFLYLDVDTASIDVNIHPTKTEIKFEDDSVIFQVLFACLKECLGKNSYIGRIDFDQPSSAVLPQTSRSFDEFSPQNPYARQDTPAPTYNPFESDGLPNEQHWEQQKFEGASGSQAYTPRDAVDRREDYGKLFEDKMLTAHQCLVFRGKYIITPSRSGLMIINIHRARERVLYDRFMDALSGSGHHTQPVLFPVTVRVGVENVLLLDGASETLTAAGFDIACFGTDTIVVNGVPEGFSTQEGSIETMVSDLLLILNDGNPALPELLNATMAEKLARLGAANAENLTSPQQAQCLIDALFACGTPDYTASGRRVLTIVPDNEIGSKF